MSIFFLVVWFCFMFMLMFRTHRVGKFRIDMLNKMSASSKIDLSNGGFFTWDWRMRYWENEFASFDKMLFQFWKPLNSFITDKKYFEPKGGHNGGHKDKCLDSINSGLS